MISLILNLMFSKHFAVLAIHFYPTAFKGCAGIVFTYGIRMGGRVVVQVGGRREKVCQGCISETIM